MECKELTRITDGWLAMTDTVLSLQEIAPAELQSLLRDTYLALRAYHTETVIPKEVSRLLLEMQDFLYFASLMEEKEVGVGFYRVQLLSALIDALKRGFFAADYGCAYPALTVSGLTDTPFTVRFDGDIFAR